MLQQSNRPRVPATPLAASQSSSLKVPRRSRSAFLCRSLHSQTSDQRQPNVPLHHQFPGVIGITSRMYLQIAFCKLFIRHIQVPRFAAVVVDFTLSRRPNFGRPMGKGFGQLHVACNGTSSPKGRQSLRGSMVELCAAGVIPSYRAISVIRHRTDSPPEKLLLPGTHCEWAVQLPLPVHRTQRDAAAFRHGVYDSSLITASCSTPLLAKTAPWSNDSGLPSGLVTRPPASSTIREPAAISQALRAYSQ